jgi:hypothetical protein
MIDYIITPTIKRGIYHAFFLSGFGMETHKCGYSTQIWSPTNVDKRIDGVI